MYTKLYAMPDAFQISQIVTSDDGHNLVSIGVDGKAKLWNLPNRTLLHDYEVSSQPVSVQTPFHEGAGLNKYKA